MNQNVSAKLNEIRKKRQFLANDSFVNYSRNPIGEISHFNWYKQIDAPIKYDANTNKFISNLKPMQYAYLSYNERNTNFKEPPNNIINFNREIQIESNIELDNNIEVLLAINAYHNGELIHSSTYCVNQKLVVKLPENSNSVRYSLRVKDAGEFKVNYIKLNNQFIWKSDDVVLNNFIHLSYGDLYYPKNKNIEFNSIENYFEFKSMNDRHIYLPFKVPNTNFEEANIESTFKLSKNSIAVSFEGESTSNLDVKLTVVLYSSNFEKLSIIQSDLNSKSYIEVEENAEYCRVAIRVKGEGLLKINKLVINNIGLWLPLTFNNSLNNDLLSDMTIHLDDSKLFKTNIKTSKINYYPYNKIFESTLVGKQFEYLTCMENIALDEVPNESLFELKKDAYYDIQPKVKVIGNTRLTLFLISYQYNKQIETIQVEFNKNTSIKFNENATAVKCILRVSGDGYFSRPRLLINEKKIEILNKVGIDLNSECWYVPRKDISLSYDGGKLHIDSDIKGDKKYYLSYNESNNAFSIAPTFNVLPINPDSEYEFNIKLNIDGIELLPMLIQYSGDEKLQVLQLKANMKTIVKMHPNATAIRIAFRLAGRGVGIVEKFEIIEKQQIKTKIEKTYIDSKEISKLNKGQIKPLKQLKMAVIFDVFTTAAYEKECELIKVSPENWLEELTLNRPDLLMVESAWQGNGGLWNKRVGYYGEENMKPLFELLEWCKKENIPTVFWNKEDPVHFNRFIQTAVNFDYIFTTDENMVSEYKKMAGHENVYALPFAAQPAINNPIKIVETRENKACFAGSYYRLHEDRAKDMDRVLDAAAKYGLVIYDRNYEKNLRGLMPNHMFPEKYQPFIKGSLKYYEIDKAYKGYKVMINVNTVKHSPTMFSRRVFEGLACGTPVVSTYAEGVEKMFGDLVYISENEDEINEAFRTLLQDEQAYRKKAMIGIREVLSKHTYTERLKYITSIVGLPYDANLPRITVLAFANSSKEFDRVVEQFNRQTYDNKELYVIIDQFENYIDYYRTYNNEKIKTFIGSYMNKYKNIKEIIETPFVTFMSHNDYYGKHYLEDLMLCTTYTSSDFIGKSAYYTINNSGLEEVNSGNEYVFVTSLKPSSTIMKTDSFLTESFEDVLLKFKENRNLDSYLQFGKTFYSNDKYNYLHNAFKDINSIDEALVQQVEL